LDPVVLVNRADSIKDIAAFFADEGASILYVYGMAGIGKSTLVRGAIELRRAETPVVWIGCENLDVDHPTGRNQRRNGPWHGAFVARRELELATRIASVLGGITTPGIVILDGFEALLDETGNLNSSDLADGMDAFANA